PRADIAAQAPAGEDCDTVPPVTAVVAVANRRDDEAQHPAERPSHVFTPIATRDGRSKPSVIRPRGPRVERQNTAVRATDGTRRSRMKRRLRTLGLATMLAGILASPASAAFVSLPSNGAQVNDDAANSIDPNEDAGLVGVAGG